MDEKKKHILENLNKKQFLHLQNYADVNVLKIDKPCDSEIVTQKVLSEMPVNADILNVEVQPLVHLDNDGAEFVNYSLSEDEMGGELSQAKIKCFKNEGSISNALRDHNYTSQEMGSSHQDLDTIKNMLLNQIFVNGLGHESIPKTVSCFIDSTLAKIQMLRFESRCENVKDSQKSSEATIAQDVSENCSEPLEVDLNDVYFESLYKNLVKNNTLDTLLAQTISFARELFNDCKITTIQSEYAFNLFILGKIQKLRNILTIDCKNVGTQTSTLRNRFLNKRCQENYDAKIKLLRKTSSSSTLDSNINDTHTEINLSASSICNSDLGLSKITSIKHYKNHTTFQKQGLNDEIDLSKYIKIDLNCRKFKEDSWIHLNEHITSDDDTDKEIERDISEKLRLLEEWSLSTSKKAGCLLVGYEAFRTLVFYHSYKNRGNLTSGNLEIIRDKVKKYLLEPGPDLVVCDEGHIIKNSKSAISLAVAQIKTKKRIILTGTPIQNNLKEYYSMVNFIKPLYLGTEREFANLYANPIKNGQHKDSGKKDITVMKQRSYVLHKKLSKFVQRKEAELLKTFLPQKFEYVLFIPMTDVQNTLYEYILDAISIRGDSRGKSLITDYTVLRKIWTHPKVLEDAWKNANTLKYKKDARKVACLHSDEDQPDDIYDRQTGIISVTNDWWRQYLSKKDLETIMPSNKLRTMFSILRLCEEKGEKCLIFSAFVAVLNVVEYFFKKINGSDPEILQNIHVPSSQTITNKWIIGQDYYRLDGKTPKHIRHEMIKRFNNESNRRARVFLISAKAGGQGVNLVGANRVIILDTSWNPSNDQQNIFRIFRLGQKKNCYIYRLISMGTMEEKVYSRSVTKQAMSFRVIDEQQIDRHYNMAELAELYTLTKPQKTERTVPVLPKDTILAYLLRHSELVYKYHEHDSLLESKIEQELSEQEKADAWETYEKELQLNFTQQDVFNTDRVQSIWPSKSGPNSCITVPNLDMQTLLNYSLQSAAFIPHYNYSMSPTYLDTFNLYQKYSMQYSDINSSLNDGTYGSSRFKAISTSNGLSTSTSIMPKGTLSDFGLYDHQKLHNINSQIQHTFTKDMIRTDKQKPSSLADYQHLLENPLPSLLNYSSPTSIGILNNGLHETMRPLQSILSHPSNSRNTPSDIDKIIAKSTKVLNDDFKRKSFAHESSIKQIDKSINVIAAQISTTKKSSLKDNPENMSVQQHVVAPSSFDQKDHKKKSYKSDNSNVLSLTTKDYIQNNAEMEIIPTTSPPGTSSITKQLNAMSPSISVTAVHAIKKKRRESKNHHFKNTNRINYI
ncbi:uncharacterized protein [Drosophila tropicalis]|uniref:uncharacterized protein isoform X8 n=1 Tax=Drosophila tropicalis TaxID=46794 RepID=UPI0035AB8567